MVKAISRIESFWVQYKTIQSGFTKESKSLNVDEQLKKKKQYEERKSSFGIKCVEVSTTKQGHL